MLRLWGSWYSNWPAWTHGFNAKIGLEKSAPSPEISVKMCQILVVWFGRPIFDTFLLISSDSLHTFQNRFLRWNRESELVNLNTMNPIIQTIFFSLIKGSEPFCRRWERCSHKSEKFEIDHFQFTYPHRHSGGECCNFLAKKVNFGQPYWDASNEMKNSSKKTILR